MLVLGLQHEIAYLFGLCLFAAQIILEPQGRKTLLISSAAVVALAVIWIGLCSLHRPDLLGIAAERCVSMRPNGYPNAHEVWDVYCLRHTEATLASDFRAWRPILLPFQFIACGIFNLVMMVTVLAHLRQTSAKRWQVASLLGVLIIPYGLVTIALDVDRIVVMSAFVNWLIIDAWLDLYTVRQKGPGNNRESRMSRWGIALLVLLQVPLNYPSIDSYGQYRLLPPDIADRYLIATRSWVTPIFTRYNLQAPAVLNPDICLDFRCSRGQGGGE